MTSSAPSSRNCTMAGFFLMSMAMLIFELLISRVMSAVAFYHFAFMAICLALFGISVGAVIVHAFKKTLTGHYSRSLYYSALFFSYTIFVSLFCVGRLKAFTLTKESYMLPDYGSLLILFAAMTLPLVACGVCLSLVFERHAREAGHIYFINLIGASLGCLLFIPIINHLEMVNCYFLLVFAGLFAASLFNRGDMPSKNNYLLAVSVMFALVMAMNHQTGSLELQWVKGDSNGKFFFKKWNSFSYVRLMDEGVNIPKGWSYGPKKYDELMATKVHQILLDIDGGAGTFMPKFSGRNMEAIKFLGYDLTSLPYHLVRDGDALVIGVGAGRDILTGLLFNQRSITGVEINDTILNIHRTTLSKFNGDLSRHPKVTFINNEARSFINASDKKFDIIQISLIDTFAATQAGAYALSENNLYTTEAIGTYWDHLTDGGMVSISYWTEPYMPKIVGASTRALDARGVRDPRAHMALIHSDYPKKTKGVANLLVKKTPFTDEELTAIHTYCEEMGFHLALSAYGSPFESLTRMSDVAHMDDFVRRHELNIAPATDDKPFFFLVTRLNMSKALKEFGLFDMEAEKILFSLLFLMFYLTVLFILIPLMRMTKAPLSDTPVFPFAVYFTAIGLAFMFVEMSQVTRLSSFLGHPVYSLALVLFSFLFGSGLGSYTIGKSEHSPQVFRLMGFFIVLCMISGAFTAPVLHHFSQYPVGMRMLITVIMLFPLAFFMGAFLPQGIRLLGQKNAPVALFWGLNGAASVLGSILAMIFQISYGLSMTFFFGTGLYVLAIATLFYLKSKTAG